MELGYEVSEEDRAKSYIEVSGRKGFGVKADDLLDALITAAKKEVDSRHPELDEQERLQHQPADRHRRAALLHAEVHQAVGHRLRLQGGAGLRGRNRAVRAVRRGARHQHLSQGRQSSRSRRSPPTSTTRAIFADESGTEIWELWLLAGKTSFVIEQCIATTEPAFAAKHAFQLAQQFNNFYHRHHILTEADEGRKKFLLATAAVVRRELINVLGVMGITVPPVM